AVVAEASVRGDRVAERPVAGERENDQRRQPGVRARDAREEGTRGPKELDVPSSTAVAIPERNRARVQRPRTWKACRKRLGLPKSAHHLGDHLTALEHIQVLLELFFFIYTPEQRSLARDRAWAWDGPSRRGRSTKWFDMCSFTSSCAVITIPCVV